MDVLTQRQQMRAAIPATGTTATEGTDHLQDDLADPLAPVQLDGRGDGEKVDVHRASESGLSGGGTSLPHSGKIQEAFGHHDVGGITAHTDSKAQDAGDAMGANAWASGSEVGFAKGSTDLHTSAHEAAHIVQQRSGVSLAGGVGQSGDAYEQHADQVADAVVSGKDASSLLDAGPGGGSGTPVQLADDSDDDDVQHKVQLDEHDSERDDDVQHKVQLEVDDGDLKGRKRDDS